MLGVLSDVAGRSRRRTRRIGRRPLCLRGGANAAPPDRRRPGSTVRSSSIGAAQHLGLELFGPRSVGDPAPTISVPDDPGGGASERHGVNWHPPGPPSRAAGPRVCTPLVSGGEVFLHCLGGRKPVLSRNMSTPMVSSRVVGRQCRPQHNSLPGRSHPEPTVGGIHRVAGSRPRRRCRWARRGTSRRRPAGTAAGRATAAITGRTRTEEVGQLGHQDLPPDRHNHGRGSLTVNCAITRLLECCLHPGTGGRRAVMVALTLGWDAGTCGTVTSTPSGRGGGRRVAGGRPAGRH